MSAFIVSDFHIHALLSWANKNQVYFQNGLHSDNTDDLEKIGNALFKANVDSVNHRYPNHKAEPELPYVLKFVTRVFTPVEILKACDCFDYQSCELDNYYQSNAAGYINSIRFKATSKLPGYDAADWALSE